MVLRKNLWLDETCFEGPVVGVDEVGRGPWAGPVVAAAVGMEPGWWGQIQTQDPRWGWIQDSKKVAPAKRAVLYGMLTSTPQVRWSVGVSSVEEIDTLNIRQATLKAMERAWQGLGLDRGTLLIDGRDGLKTPASVTCYPMVQGDARYVSIAAASVVAKVYRDRLMDQLHKDHPYYGWDRNKGYGTSDHTQGLQNHGVTSHHRKSFKPIAHLIGACFPGA